MATGKAVKARNKILNKRQQIRNIISNQMEYT